MRRPYPMKEVKMTDFLEVKNLFSKTQETVEALRSEVEEMKGKTADVVDADRLAKMEADLAEKLETEQKAVSDRLANLETAANRPDAGAKAVEQDAYAKSFNDFLRKGAEPDELKSMSTDSNADGGYLVSGRMAEGIQERLRRTSPVRQVANVVSGSGTYSLLVERGDAGFGWVGERETRAETTTPTINKISIAQEEMYAKPKISQRMLDDANFDVEGFLVAQITDRFARAEATAFVSGNGQDKPKGFTAYSTATTADDSRAVETLQHRVTGANGEFASSDPADVIIETFYDLQAAYQANASWMMKNTTAAAVAALKDGDGTYLLQAILNADGTIVRTIQGRPMYVADDMPTYTGTGALAIAVGDFARGYTINDGVGTTVLRDPYSEKPFVQFYTTKRVGGGVTDFDAIKFIKFSA